MGLVAIALLMLGVLLVGAVVTILAGSFKPAASGHKEKSQGKKLLILGDDTARTLWSQLRSQLRGFELVSQSTRAGKAADCVLVAINALDGPGKYQRRALATLRSLSGTPLVLIVLTNTHAVRDPELLELEELEMREMMNEAGLAGDDVQVGFDSAAAPVDSTYQCPKGIKNLARFISTYS